MGEQKMSKYRAFRSDIILSIAAAPLYIAATGRYGLRITALLIMTCAAGFILEFLAKTIMHSKVRGYSITAWVLFPLIIPPALPIWMALVSFLFGILASVVFFGGHGRQFISPAAVGWSFALLSFPAAFGFGWTYPFSSPLTGFTRWSAMVPTIDDPVTLFSVPDRISEFIQPILSGNFPQPPANTLPLLTLIIGLLLLLLRASDTRTAFSFIITYAAVQALLAGIAPESTPDPTVHLVGLPIFTAFFLLPDHRTCARTFAGRWFSGAVAGISGVLILNYSSFPGGIIFAVLLANVFSAIIDEGVLSIKYRRAHERG